jgi:hypothetical protein
MLDAHAPQKNIAYMGFRHKFTTPGMIKHMEKSLAVANHSFRYHASLLIVQQSLEEASFVHSLV